MDEDSTQQNIPQEMMSISSKFSTDVFKLLVDHRELITESFRTVTGYEVKWSADGSPVLVEGEFRMMNRIGALNIFNFLRMSINSVTSLTDWDDERANLHLRMRMNEFSKSFTLNYKVFEVNPLSINNIVSGVRQLLDASLRMAVGGKHRQAVTENVQKLYQEHKGEPKTFFQRARGES